MIQKFSLLLFVLLCISCKNNTLEKPKKPANLISEKEMINILYDISIISAAKGVNKKLLEENGVNPEEYIYNKHKIDSLQFALSSEYYAYNIKTYEEIFNRVKLKLEEDQARFDSIVKYKKTFKDSIAKTNRGKLDSLKKLDLIKNMEKKELQPSKSIKKN